MSLHSYNILYTEEDTTQTNILEEDIRPAPIVKRKKKKPTTSKSGKKRKAGGGNGRGEDIGDGDRAGDDTAAGIDAEHFDLARSMGLPDGWAVKRNKNYKLSIWGPDGRRYRSKKAAFESARLEPPKLDEVDGGARKRHRGRPRKKASGEEEEDHPFPLPEELRAEAKAEEGDPPWRTDGHEHMGRRVRYAPPGAPELRQTGTVTGWISEKDVDRAGDPGFISERTGEPASLFHVTFDQPGGRALLAGELLESQDFELSELEELSLAGGESYEHHDEETDDADEDGNSDGDSQESTAKLLSDEDDIPLSTILKKKGKMT